MENKDEEDIHKGLYGSDSDSDSEKDPKLSNEIKLSILEKVKKDGLYLKELNDTYKKDKEIVLEAVKENGLALEYVDESLKKDKEIVSTAVFENGFALRYADKDLRKDKEIVLKSLEFYPYAMRYVDISLKKDKTFIKDCIYSHSCTSDIMKFMDDCLKKDRNFILEIINDEHFRFVNKNGTYYFIHKDLQKDKEIISKLLEFDHYILDELDESLIKDVEIIRKFVRYVDRPIYLNDSLRKNKEFMKIYTDEMMKFDKEKKKIDKEKTDKLTRISRLGKKLLENNIKLKYHEKIIKLAGEIEQLKIKNQTLSEIIYGFIKK